MQELAIQLRAMQLFAHNAHHFVAHAVFQQDHEFFGEVYEALDGDYDAVVERMIGLYGAESVPALGEIIADIGQKLEDAPGADAEQNAEFYEYLLGMEQQLIEICTDVVSGEVSPGTEQLVGDICDRSEIRCYKIKQRLAK